MPQRIAVPKLSDAESPLPAWVKHFVEGGTGPGDLANPMEGPITVAAQSPALMRRMGAELLQRLEARGDVPESVLGVLRHLQSRYPRLFGHLDDVKIGPIDVKSFKEGGKVLGRMTGRDQEGMRAGPMVSSEFNADTDNPFLHVGNADPAKVGSPKYNEYFDEFQDEMHKSGKYSTMRLDPKAIAADPRNDIAQVVGHEFGHGPQRVMNPDFADLYQRQIDANTAITRDPFLSYQQVSYEKNAEAMGDRIKAEMAQTSPTLNKVGTRRRLPLAAPMMPHPTAEQISNRYNREALIELMTQKLMGGGGTP